MQKILSTILILLNFNSFAGQGGVFGYFEKPRYTGPEEIELYGKPLYKPKVETEEAIPAEAQAPAEINIEQESKVAAQEMQQPQAPEVTPENKVAIQEAQGQSSMQNIEPEVKEAQELSTVAARQRRVGRLGAERFAFLKSKPYVSQPLEELGKIKEQQERTQAEAQSQREQRFIQERELLEKMQNTKPKIRTGKVKEKTLTFEE